MVHNAGRASPWRAVTSSRHHHGEALEQTRTLLRRLRQRHPGRRLCFSSAEFSRGRAASKAAIASSAGGRNRNHALRRGTVRHLDLPAYAEQAVVGFNTFALAYGAKSVTASRSELGLRSDKSFAMSMALHPPGYAQLGRTTSTPTGLSVRRSRRCRAHPSSSMALCRRTMLPSSPPPRK